MVVQPEPSPDRSDERAEIDYLSAELSRLRLALSTMLERDARERRERDEFLSYAAHELRTPLTLILGYSQSLARRLLGREGAERDIHDLEMVIGATRRLNGMVDELLDVSRIESGRLKLSPEPLALDLLVREIAGRLGDGRRLDLVVEADLPTVLGDPARVGQVLELLIANALRVTPPERLVEVALRQAPGGVEVTVLDGGAAIPPGVLPEIFERSRAYPEVGVDRRRGLGVGLFVARGIIQALGGEIRAEALGEGNCFRLLLRSKIAPPVDVGGNPA